MGQALPPALPQAVPIESVVRIAKAGKAKGLPMAVASGTPQRCREPHPRRGRQVKSTLIVCASGDLTRRRHAASRDQEPDGDRAHRPLQRRGARLPCALGKGLGFLCVAGSCARACSDAHPRTSTGDWGGRLAGQAGARRLPPRGVQTGHRPRALCGLRRCVPGWNGVQLNCAGPRAAGQVRQTHWPWGHPGPTTVHADAKLGMEAIRAAGFLAAIDVTVFPDYPHFA